MSKKDKEEHLYILDEIERNPSISQRNLAKKANISLGAVNYALNKLIDKGLVKTKNFINSDNKFGYLYVLTPKGISEKAKLARNFLTIKYKEYQKINKILGDQNKHDT